MTSACSSFCHEAKKKPLLHCLPASGAGPALEPTKVMSASASGLAMAIMTLEKVTPATMSTLSFSMNFCTICTPTSGLSWSSSLTRSIFWPPSLPPFCSSASMKPSYMSCPSAAALPDMVAMKPTLTSAVA